MLMEERVRPDMLERIETLQELLAKIRSDETKRIVRPLARDSEITFKDMTKSQIEVDLENMAYRQAKGLPPKRDGLPAGYWCEALSFIMLDPICLLNQKG